MTTRLPRILVIGVGSIGERHVRCFQQTGRCDVGICEVDNQLCARVAERYQIEAAFKDLSSALGSSFDAAVICTPAHLHLPIATQTTAAGLDLLIEKPLSTSTAGIDDLDRAIAARGLVAGVAYVYRSHPALAAMKAAIESGRFGRPVEVVAVAGQHFPTYRPAYRDIYYNCRETGGGAIQDALTHVINFGEWLVGPVTSVVADAAHLVLAGVEVEDTVHVLARHGDLLASYSLNQHQTPNETTMTVICERGTLRFEAHRHRWRWSTEPGAPWQEEACELRERDDLFVRQAHSFLDAIASRSKFPCTFAEGLQSLQVNLAILRSITSRRWEELA